MTGLQIIIPGDPGVSYRPIDEFDGYAVGDDGSVWSMKSLNGQGMGHWHELRGFISRGYRRVLLRRDGQIEKRFVHRLVLAVFCGGGEGLDVRHLNGIRTDNRLKNLAWGTPAENAIDRDQHGTTPRGESHGMAKLSAPQVMNIRERLRCGESKASIAREFGIGTTTVKHIASGKNWRCIA